jgi:hypothetical protein
VPSRGREVKGSNRGGGRSRRSAIPATVTAAIAARVATGVARKQHGEQ